MQFLKKKKKKKKNGRRKNKKEEIAKQLESVPKPKNKAIKIDTSLDLEKCEYIVIIWLKN